MNTPTLAQSTCNQTHNGLHTDTRGRCGTCGHPHCSACSRCARCQQNAEPGTLRQRPRPYIFAPCAQS